VSLIDLRLQHGQTVNEARQRLQSTDWEGNAKLAAVDAVQGFTNSAQQKCNSAEQTLTKYITDQVNNVTMADR